MTTICYIFIYLFETIISFIYFKNKYHVKRSKAFTLFSYFSMFLIQYLFNFMGIPNLNLAIFFATNFFISVICYQNNILQSLFNSILITALMLTSELCIFLFVNYCLTPIFWHIQQTQQFYWLKRPHQNSYIFYLHS